jgi:ammonium transporter
MNKETIDILWIIVASGLVFVMQAGFAMLESGLTRSKNSINVAIKNLTDVGVSLFLYWLFGFAIMFGLSWNGILGTDLFFFSPATAWTAAFLLFQSVFCSTAATIVSGAVAERMKYSSYIIATTLLAAFIYPVFGHWAWGGALSGEAAGWLARLGFVDFAGSTVVHSVGGWIALASVIVIGPRIGRFDEQGNPRTMQGSNLTVAVFGVIILWFGWFGFNGGSTLSMGPEVAGIILRTSIAASTGMIAALVTGWPIYRRPDASLLLNGALAGLVAITAPVHAVSEGEAALIGALGGVVMLGSLFLLERLRIDDAVGAIPVHLAAGIWGTLAVAIFGDPAILGTEAGFWQRLGVQALGIVTCGAWSFGLALLVLSGINRFIPLRVTEEEEMNGLNFSEHHATTELHNLFQVMEKQAREGDLSLRVPADPFTEAGQIALRYNSVLDSLETSMEERDREAQARISSEARYRALVDNSDVIIFSMDPSMRLDTVNEAVKKHFRVEPERLKGTSFMDLVYYEKEGSLIEKEILEQKLEELKEGNRPVEFNARFKSERIIEPLELLVRLEPVVVGGREEILGRAYRVTDDRLTRYLLFEKQRFSIENLLMTAEDITHRLTRNLRRFLDGDSLTRLRVALREVIINAIEHGNLGISFEEKTKLMIEDRYYSFLAQRQRDKRYRDKRVEIEYMVREDRVQYRITDQGEGFDHQAVLNRDPSRANEDMLTHGRGLALVKDIFDSVQFNRKGNQVLLVKELEVPG